MTVIRYKCDTCKREIDLQQNPQGLEIISRCIITDDRRGKPFQIEDKVDHIIGTSPPREKGLDDWTQRKVLFNFKQSIELSEWKINHNLGIVPIVQVYVERPKNVDLNSLNLSQIDIKNLVDLIKIEPLQIEIIDENNLILHFDRTESGIAQFIARATKSNNTNLPITINEPTTFQLSNNNQLSIATLNSDTNITIEMEFVTEDGTVITDVYMVDDQPGITSPWVNFNEIWVLGLRYTVRNFNFIETNAFFANGTINNGASFKITKINGVSLQPQEVLVLLANSPYKVLDKITESIVDPTSMIDNELNYFYNNGELYINKLLIRNIYPYIKSV